MPARAATAAELWTPELIAAADAMQALHARLAPYAPVPGALQTAEAGNAIWWLYEDRSTDLLLRIYDDGRSHLLQRWLAGPFPKTAVAQHEDILSAAKIFAKGLASSPRVHSLTFGSGVAIVLHGTRQESWSFSVRAQGNGTPFVWDVEPELAAAGHELARALAPELSEGEMRLTRVNAATEVSAHERLDLASIDAHLTPASRAALDACLATFEDPAVIAVRRDGPFVLSVVRQSNSDIQLIAAVAA